MKEIRFVHVSGPQGRTKSKPVKAAAPPRPQSSSRRSTTKKRSGSASAPGATITGPSQTGKVKPPPRPPKQASANSSRTPSSGKSRQTTFAAKPPQSRPQPIPGRTITGFTRTETLYDSADINVITPKPQPPRQLPQDETAIDDVIDSRKHLIEQSEHRADDASARASALAEMLRRRRFLAFDSPFTPPGENDVSLVERRRYFGYNSFNGDWQKHLEQDPDRGKINAFPASHFQTTKPPSPSPTSSQELSPSPPPSPSPYEEAQETLAQAMAEGCERSHKPNPYFYSKPDYFRTRKHHPPLPVTKQIRLNIAQKWPPGIYDLAQRLEYEMRLSTSDDDDTEASDHWLRRQLHQYPHRGHLGQFQLSSPPPPLQLHYDGGIEYRYRLSHIPSTRGWEPRHRGRAHNITPAAATVTTPASASMAASSSSARPPPWLVPSVSDVVTVPLAHAAPASAVGALKTATPPSPPSPPRPALSPTSRSSQSKRRSLRQSHDSAHDRSHSMNHPNHPQSREPHRRQSGTTNNTATTTKRRRVEASSQFPESEPESASDSIEEIAPEEFPEPITIKRERLSMTSGDMGFPLSSQRLSLENRRSRRNSLADRQASLQNRSRRISLRGIQAEIHPSVPRDQFYRHIDPAASASERFSQLLVLTSKSRQREWESKPQLQSSSVRATGRSLITTILNNISAPVFDFNRPPGQTQTRVRVANPKNDELRQQLSQCTQALKQIQDERDEWVRQLKQVKSTTSAMAVPLPPHQAPTTMETPILKRAAATLESTVDAIAGVSDEFAARAHQQAAILDMVGYASAVAGPPIDEAITQMMVPSDPDQVSDLDLLKHWHQRKVAASGSDTNA